MPRVTMNGSSPRKATSQPLTAPMMPPMIRATTQPEEHRRAAEQAGRDDGGEAERGADADVDAAGQHDDQLGERDHADDRHLQQQVGEVGAAPEDRAAGDRRDQQQRDQDVEGVLALQPADDGAAPLRLRLGLLGAGRGRSRWRSWVTPSSVSGSGAVRDGARWVPDGVRSVLVRERGADQVVGVGLGGVELARRSGRCASRGCGGRARAAPRPRWRPPARPSRGRRRRG